MKLLRGWRSSLEKDIELLRRCIEPLYELALGGTSVGTGLNAPEGFDKNCASGSTANKEKMV